MALTFLWIAVLLLLAKLSGLVEKIKQPAVFGELLIGVLIGNLYLLGINIFEGVKENNIIQFLAELGVIILLFQTGLESNIKKMREVGVRALLVAIVGVVAPLVMGTYVVGPWILPGYSSETYLFLGAALTATSVGITARVFKDMGKLNSREATIVLGAAVIDDVLGLIILAVISALVTLGTLQADAIGWIFLKATSFLAGSIIAGQLLAPMLGKMFSKINMGVGMKFIWAISFGLIMAYFAQLVGLAPIVGAFAAGLILDPVHFKYFKDISIVHDIRGFAKKIDASTGEKLLKTIESHSHRQIEYFVEPLGHFFVPIFFVMTGMMVKLETLFDPSILLTALGISVVALAGKILAGVVAGRGVNKLIVGWSMIPRGEVGLIFATVGKSLGVVPDEVFSIIIIMVIVSTFVFVPVLTYLLRRTENLNASVSNISTSSQVV